MKRRSHIDLTPLLDVILMLVFGFMFVLAANATKLSETEDALKTSQSENAAAVAELQTENDALNAQVSDLQTTLDAEAATLETASAGIAEYFSLNQSELSALLSQQSSEDVRQYLSQTADPGDVAKSMVMYDLLTAEFYFLDVVLSGEDNRVVINGQRTSVIIRVSDIADADSRLQKKQAVKDAISEVIDARPGGSSMVFVTLSTDNPEVYHYAWSLVWQAVSELTEKYGAKNYYSAEIFIKENTNDE